MGRILAKVCILWNALLFSLAGFLLWLFLLLISHPRTCLCCANLMHTVLQCFMTSGTHLILKFQNVYNLSVLQPKNDSGEPSYLERTQGPGDIYCSGVQRVIITAICATDLTLGLQRIPAGFYAVVKADGTEYQTRNKAVHVVKWHELIFLGDVCRAVELLERGRTIIWTRMTWIRTLLRAPGHAAIVQRP
ncbi:uncharacterized protein EDB93DRAFT_1336647 [Suillus bovinus]|uniref:uncharacterized protein n=1 Tax=Suillus bovinus TaxID=48563 RepID=UPI001B883BC5|nr:uncharacterized protein EDB93DRAFT_1336647 [Suillus bovinus]KAG2151657.1 hypothetical protein EDB93DRAFT_1336647 [Suillus bovinus]